MILIDTPTCVNAIPTLADYTPATTPGYFTDGNPTSGQPATQVSAKWLNAVGTEIVSVVVGAGLTLDTTGLVNNQLLSAIQSLIGTAISKSATYCGTAGGTANAITLTPTPAITSYPVGSDTYIFLASNTNTGAVTISINGLTTLAVMKEGVSGLTALTGGEIKSGEFFYVRYDGTVFQLSDTAFGTASSYNVGTGSNQIPALDTNGNLLLGSSSSIAKVYALTSANISAGLFQSSSTSQTNAIIYASASGMGNSSSYSFLTCVNNSGTVLTVDGSGNLTINGTVTANGTLLQNAPTTQAFFKNLKIQVTGSTGANASADYVCMANSSGNTISKAVSSIINTSTNGLNGLDTGSLAAATWYYVWAVSNGTTTGTVISTSSTAPNSSITTTYPYVARIGALRTAPSTSGLMATIQYGRRVQYVVGGVNVTTQPMLATGTSLGWQACSVTSVVPPTASVITLSLYLANVNTASAAAAPNANYSAVSYAPLFVYASTYGPGGVSYGTILLESTSVYYYASNASCYLSCFGFEDNL